LTDLAGLAELAVRAQEPGRAAAMSLRVLAQGRRALART
jgi:hypothetical protein